jgi:uncharacterized protein YjbJ (UPF0337 family)
MYFRMRLRGNKAPLKPSPWGDDFGVPGFRRATKRRAFGCALEVIRFGRVRPGLDSHALQIPALRFLCLQTAVNRVWPYLEVERKMSSAGLVFCRRDHKGRTQMKPSTKNEVKGTIHEVKGKIKEKAGRATKNPRLEEEGTDEKIAGKVQRKIGQVQKVTEDF